MWSGMVYAHPSLVSSGFLFSSVGFTKTPVTLANLIKRSCGGYEHELYGLSYGKGA